MKDMRIWAHLTLTYLPTFGMTASGHIGPLNQYHYTVGTIQANGEPNQHERYGLLIGSDEEMYDATLIGKIFDLTPSRVPRMGESYKHYRDRGGLAMTHLNKALFDTLVERGMRTAIPIGEIRIDRQTNQAIRQSYWSEFTKHVRSSTVADIE